MNSNDRRPYHSPRRQAQAQETRERILASVATWLQREGASEFTLEAIAAEAGVERRTLFRHFATREALLDAFWVWINTRVAATTLPGSLEELLAAPRETFARFDEHEGVIRASLHTAAGQAMRRAQAAARRTAFTAALREVTRDLSVADRRRLTAVVHALYSAASWETMRDYAGVSGAQAGDAAAWAIRVLIESVRDNSTPASPSKTPTTPTTPPIST